MHFDKKLRIKWGQTPFFRPHFSHFSNLLGDDSNIEELLTII